MRNREVLTCGSIPGKTRLCRDCGARRGTDAFPRDKYGRPDYRMCLQCIDEHTPVLMTENEAARWWGITIAAVRELAPDGHYSPPRGKPVALYARGPETH